MPLKTHKLPVIGLFACLIGLLIGLSGWTSGSSSAVVSAAETWVLTYDINRNNVPNLYFDEVTLIVTVGNASNISVTAGATPITSTYNATDGTVHFSTSATQVTVTFDSLAPSNNIGDVQKASLKDNKNWVWSHGFDDNVNLKPAVEAFRAKGWPATIFPIASIFFQNREEYWILDEPYFNSTLLVNDWALGNHSWDHERFDNDPPTMQDYTDDILDGQTHFEAAIARSSRTDFQVMVFANPNFSSAYDTPFQQATQTTDLRLQESGGDYMLVVDGSSDYSASGITARHMVGRTKIGRDIALELSAQMAKDRIDWMAANYASSGKHFWYNTLAHGNHETRITEVINYVWDEYGPGGTNEAWVASSTEIYSYLLVRDNVSVSLNGSQSTTPTPGPTATNTHTPTATHTQTPTATPTQTATHTPTSTATQTAVSTAPATATTVPNATPTLTQIPTGVPTQTPTSAPSMTFTPIATADPDATSTPVATATLFIIPTTTPTATSTLTAVPTNQPASRLKFIFLPMLQKPTN